MPDTHRVIGGTVWAKAEAVSKDCKRIFGAAIKEKFISGRVLDVIIQKKNDNAKRAITYIKALYTFGEFTKEKIIPLQSLKDHDPGAPRPVAPPAPNAPPAPVGPPIAPPVAPPVATPPALHDNSNRVMIKAWRSHVLQRHQLVLPLVIVQLQPPILEQAVVVLVRLLLQPSQECQ